MWFVAMLCHLGSKVVHIPHLPLVSFHVLMHMEMVSRQVESLSCVELFPHIKIALKSSRKERPDEDIRRVALDRLQDLIPGDPFAMCFGCSFSVESPILSSGGFIPVSGFGNPDPQGLEGQLGMFFRVTHCRSSDWITPFN